VDKPYRDKVFVGMPCYDRRVDIACVAGLMQCLEWYKIPFFCVGNSNISLARNEIAHVFLERATECEWFVMIDSDTIFTRDDWNILWEGTEDVVCCEYARKVFGEPPVKYGLGFSRVHRRVFEKIAELKKDDGSEYALRYYARGSIFVDYFPNGPNAGSQWLSEDHGFFTLAAMAQIQHRLENRTKLRHVEPYEYGYPDQIPVEILLMLLDKAGELDKVRKKLAQLEGAQ